MYKHLINKTSNMRLRYSLGYTSDVPSKPCVSARGITENNTGTLVIDNIPWLISAEIYNKVTMRKIDNLMDMAKTSIEQMIVKMRAQTFIEGHIIQIDIGERYVVNATRDMYNGGELVVTSK